MTEAKAREAVKVRANGRCELCQRAEPLEWAHRRNRSHGGGWSPSNGLHLCRNCHSWTELNPLLGYAGGWRLDTDTAADEAVVWLRPFMIEGWYQLPATGEYVMSRHQPGTPKLPPWVTPLRVETGDASWMP